MPRAIERRHIVATLTVLLLVLAAAIGTWRLAFLQRLGDLERQVEDRLTLNIRTVESEIERFRYLPGVIGKDGRIATMLADPGDTVAIAAANAYLETVRDMSGADELYVLDLEGQTLAASNWNAPGSFVGHNYGFRPYFLDAMATGSGRFYAVGVTTGKPGYFLASRLDADGVPIGVVVAKVDMAPLAANWAAAGEKSAIADRDGVIFLSGDPHWIYRPLRPLAAEALGTMHTERRYDGVDIARALPLATAPAGRQTSLITDLGEETYLIDSRPIEPDGWRLVSALSLEPAEREAGLMGGLGALLALLSVGFYAFARQRRQIVRLKLDQTLVLEKRVAERTRELAHEVEVRRRAETELRATQENLIHAAKLAALGRMSAAIVHEVSQPLSALDNTLAATDLHAQRNATAEVHRNIANARSLLKRMQRTVKHLRTFSSRRDPGPPEAVAIAGVIEAAIEIVAPKAREGGIGLAIEVDPHLPRVAGNALRLEQVLINLLLNALDATAAAGRAEVCVAASLGSGGVSVDIADTGSGMSEDVKGRLFEPFFTTKTRGESLGLGLSISRSLLEEFGGALHFHARPGGGTIARVVLPLARVAATRPVETTS